MNYLLDFEHPEGASKAEFFTNFGFTELEWKLLADALVAHAQSNLVSSSLETEHGVKYRVDGPIRCPDGRSPIIRAVWIVDAGTDAPRLVTAHPL